MARRQTTFTPSYRKNVRSTKEDEETGFAIFIGTLIVIALIAIARKYWPKKDDDENKRDRSKKSKSSSKTQPCTDTEWENLGESYIRNRTRIQTMEEVLRYLHVNYWQYI
jgi:hypothetical protein